jgi:hypothetical protein
MKKKNTYKNTTDLDKYLAAIYFNILVKLATIKRMVGYGELVDLSKELYPEDQLVQSGLSISSGRKLEVIQHYVHEYNLPDLTSIVFNQSTNDCGEGIGHDNPSFLREAVFAHTWAGESENFLAYLGYEADEMIQLLLAQAKVNIKITKKQAEAMMSEYNKTHGKNYPPKIRTQRDNIIRLLMDGVGVEQAFQDCSQ